MTKFINKSFYLVLFIIILITLNKTFAQSGNNAFVFNGITSQLYINDSLPANTGANQNGFQFFNSNSTNNTITVQAWIYLLGDTPSDVDVPVVYRAVNGGTTFSMYVKNNQAYFSVGNNNSATVSTAEFPAFKWIALTGTYDGNVLKIYLNGDQAEPALPFDIIPNYASSSSTGLFIGKSNAGAFKGLIDEIRIFDIALGDNNINNSGGNGNPAENFPSSIAQYLTGKWSFNEISPVNLLHDLSDNKNHLHVNDIDQIVPSKHLPFFVVTSTLDEQDAAPGDGNATSLNGKVTLRSAIEEANVLSGQQTVYFYITEAEPVIQPISELPAITQPVILDGTFQSGYSGSPLVRVSGPFGGVTISGGGSIVQGLDLGNSAGYALTLSSAGGNNIEANRISGISISSQKNNINGNTISNSFSNGISLETGALSSGNLTGNRVTGNLNFGISLDTANGDTLSENEIFGNSSHGLVINGSGNDINNNTIYNNGVSGTGAGVFVESGNNNSILYNSIYDNAVLGIGLGDSANDSQVFPTLDMFYSWKDETALPEIKGGTYIEGILNTKPGEAYQIQFFANSGLSSREGKRYLAEINIASNNIGDTDFSANLKNVVVEVGEVVSATATKLDNNSNSLSTSEFSESIELNNDDGDHYIVNTTLAGIPLHWKDGKGDFEIAQSVVANGYDDEVENGFDTWSTLQQLEYTRKYLSDSEQWGGNADGLNNVVWISDRINRMDRIIYLILDA